MRGSGEELVKSKERLETRMAITKVNKNAEGQEITRGGSGPTPRVQKRPR
jgi:hypothetical protein